MTRLLLPLALLLVVAAPAVAQAPTFDLALSPAKPARATTGTLTVKDLPADAPGTPPADVIVLAVQKGFAADPKGAPGRCSEQDASAVRCPEKSAIGKGTATIEVKFGAAAPQDYTATLGVFITERKREPGDLAGLSLEIREPSTGTTLAVPGRVLKVGTRTGGLELRFEGLSKALGVLPPGITARLKSFEMSVGRKRTVTKRVRTRSGKRRRVKRTYAIVRTPKTCAGAWTGTLAIARTDGSEITQPLSAPCSG